MQFVKIMLFLTISIALLFASPSSHANNEKCEAIINTKYWLLPPKSQGLVVGILAEAEDGQRLLALDDYYWGDHKKMYEQLHKDYPLKRILWAGELLIENPENHERLGIVVLSINTSGFVWNRIKSGSLDINDPEYLKRALDEHEPKLSSQYTQHFLYCDEHPHLDSLFRKLHQQCKLMKGDTVRHRFRNVLTVATALSGFYKVKEEMEPTFEQGLGSKVLDHISSQALDELSTFGASLMQYSRRTPGVLNVTVTRMSDNLEKVRSRKIETEKDLRILVSVIDAVATQPSPNSSPDVLVLKPTDM